MIKSYPVNMRCKLCDQVFDRMTPDQSKRGRTYSFICEGCQETHVEVVDVSEASSSACHLCSNFKDCGVRNRWYGKCSKGHIGDEDEEESLGLVYVYQSCSDFERNPDGSSLL
tara:strand:+ start:66727 stop:67065 length:339 start_codon:yes stop_codon:yes gene_type:complete